MGTLRQPIDSQRFDDLARLVGAGASRRQVFKALLGGAIAAIPPLDGRETAAATRVLPTSQQPGGGSPEAVATAGVDALIRNDLDALRALYALGMAPMSWDAFWARPANSIPDFTGCDAAATSTWSWGDSSCVPTDQSTDVHVLVRLEFPGCGELPAGENRVGIQTVIWQTQRTPSGWVLVDLDGMNGNGPEFGPSCIDAPLPAEFVGSWTGTGEQTNPLGAWPVQMTLNGGEFGSVGAVEYPSLGCAGNLSLSRIDAAPASDVMLTETLSSGWEACVDRGTFELTPTESGSLLFRWTSPDGASTAEGTLTRLPPDAQTFAGSAEDAAIELSLLEAAHDYDGLYDRLHPDAQADVPRAAVVGWYREFLAGKETAALTVTGVRVVDWTWPVTGATYPNTAEVDFVQPYWENGVQSDMTDAVRLVEHPGGWGWFFGRSRGFVDEQIARFAPAGPDPTAPELRVELTVTGTPPAGTVFALRLTAPDAGALICEELTDPDGDGVYVSGNVANMAWPPGSEGYSFYGGVLLYGTDYLGSDAPGGRTSCFASEGTVIADLPFQPVVQDSILRAPATFEDAPPPSPAAIAYTVADLGTLGNWSRALGLNNNGQVVGVTDTTISPDIEGPSPQRAFLWDGAGLIDLGSLSPGAGGSSAEDINDAGQIVGDADTVKLPAAPGPLPHAFLWEQGSMVNLGTLAGNASHASAINNSGQIVGRSRLESAAGPIHAFIFESGQMTDLGTLGGIDSSATDTNDAGWIVGSASTSSGESHAAVWRDGVISDLGVLPGHSVSSANAINANGIVVGHSFDGSQPFADVHAFVWSADSGMTELHGLPNAYQTYAFDLNEAGDIVGSSGFRGDTVGVEDGTRAYLVRDGTATDLNSLIDSASGWVLIAAHAINNRGQIAGVGTISGTMIPYEARAFLLTPVDQTPGEPVPQEPADQELINWIDFAATRTMALFAATDAFVVQCREAGRFFADRFGADVAELLASVTVESVGLFFGAAHGGSSVLRDALRATTRPGLTPGAQSNLLTLARDRGYPHLAAYLASVERSATPHAAVLAPAWYMQIKHVGDHAVEEGREDLASRLAQTGFEQLLGDLFRRGEALGEAAASTNAWLGDYRASIDETWSRAREQAPPSGDLAAAYGDHLRLIARANEVVLANARVHGAMLISAWESERGGDDSLGEDIARLILGVGAVVLACALGGVPFYLAMGALAVIAVMEDADQVSESDRMAFMATSLIFASAEAALQIQMNAYNGLAQIAGSSAYPAQPQIARGAVAIARAAVRDGGDSYSEIAIENTGQDRATFEVSATYGKRIPRLLGLAPQYAEFFILADPQTLEPGEGGTFRLDYRRDGKGEEPASVSSGEVGTVAVRVEVLGSTETGRYHVGSANVEWRP